MPRARLPARLAAAALAGAVLSIAIAWAIPDTGPFVVYDAQRDRNDPWYDTSKWSRLNSTRYVRAFLFVPGEPDQPSLPEDPAALLRQVRSLDYSPKELRLVNFAARVQWAHWNADLRGFPFRCLWSWHAEGDFLNPNHRPLYSGIIVSRSPRSHDPLERRLPFTPLWPGLAADTAIWGAIVLALDAARVSLIRRVRARRAVQGLCPSCRYPTAGVQNRCPECGLDLT